MKNAQRTQIVLFLGFLFVTPSASADGVAPRIEVKTTASIGGKLYNFSSPEYDGAKIPLPKTASGWNCMRPAPYFDQGENTVTSGFVCMRPDGAQYTVSATCSLSKSDSHVVTGGFPEAQVKLVASCTTRTRPNVRRPDPDALACKNNDLRACYRVAARACSTSGSAVACQFAANFQSILNQTQDVPPQVVAIPPAQCQKLFPNDPFDISDIECMAGLSQSQSTANRAARMGQSCDACLRRAQVQCDIARNSQSGVQSGLCSGMTSGCSDVCR